MKNNFFNFFLLFIIKKKLVNEKHFPVEEKFNLISEKCITFILDEKHFSEEVVKNLKISYYLLIISNLVLKLLIAIYFVLNIFFSILSLKI
jgi:hypothetical protein